MEQLLQPGQWQPTWFDTPLGPMRAVADDLALVCLEFVAPCNLDHPPKTVLNCSGPLASIKRELRQYFSGELQVFKTPLCAKGTVFQERVWQELLRIPFGRTRSYGEIARGIGQPTASRAVGRANGANPLALVMPCHRVINANGELGGYAGSVPRKEWLLEHEKAMLRR